MTKLSNRKAENSPDRDKVVAGQADGSVMAIRRQPSPTQRIPVPHHQDCDNNSARKLSRR